MSEAFVKSEKLSIIFWTISLEFKCAFSCKSLITRSFENSSFFLFVASVSPSVKHKIISLVLTVKVIVGNEISRPSTPKIPNCFSWFGYFNSSTVFCFAL